MVIGLFSKKVLAVNNNTDKSISINKLNKSTTRAIYRTIATKLDKTHNFKLNELLYNYTLEI